jgi:hypothetical protein
MNQDLIVKNYQKDSNSSMTFKYKDRNQMVFVTTGILHGNYQYLVRDHVHSQNIEK